MRPREMRSLILWKFGKAHHNDPKSRPDDPLSCCWSRAHPASLVRTAAISLSLCSCSDHTPAGTSRCGDASTIATIKDIEGVNNPVLKIYENMGARVEATVDAIRTISGTPKGVLCRARLTVRAIRVAQKQSSGMPPDTELSKAIENAMNTKVSEITYKVELTDDGQTYVSIIPPDAETR